MTATLVPSSASTTTDRPHLRKQGGQSANASQRRIIAAEVEQLLRQPIDLMYHPSFEAPNAEELLRRAEPRRRSTRFGASVLAPRVPGGLTPYLASLYQTELLTAEEESYLFRKMNFRKFQAARLRDALDPQASTAEDVQRVRDLLGEVEELRNQILTANLRLVVSIAKRYVDEIHSFSELVSDGNLSLMRAAEKFDFGRGFRFSTYATWAIRKNFHRSIARNRAARRRQVPVDDPLSETVADEQDVRRSEGAMSRLREELIRILDRLGERERAIVTARFGLEGDTEPQTLQQVAQDLGICKERVRQLQVRALRKLQEFACEERIEPPSD